MSTLRPFEDDGWDGGDWDDGDWDWGDEESGDDSSDADYPGDEYPGGDFEDDWGGEFSSEFHFEGDEVVGTFTLSANESAIDREEFSEYDGWTDPHGLSAIEDESGTSPHAGQSILSAAQSAGPLPGGRYQNSSSDVRFSLQVSNGVGWGVGYALLVGPSASIQYQGSVGNRDTELGLNVFLGMVGMGGFVSPPTAVPGFSANFQFAAPTSMTAQVNTGCVRSAIFVLPIVSLQVSETEYGSGVLNDITLAIGATFGLGVFGGVSCSASLRSPSW